MDTEDGLEEFIQELSEEIGVPVISTFWKKLKD